MRSPRTAKKSSPRSPQLEKATRSNKDPTQPKNKKQKNLLYKKKYVLVYVGNNKYSNSLLI